MWLLQGGCVWLLQEACVVDLGGVWLLLGGMRGCSWGMHGCFLEGVVALGGCAWDTMRYGDTISERAVCIPLECILVAM